MRPLTLAFLILCTAGASLRAGGHLELRAQEPTRIYVDGEFVGETPLTLANMQAGDYQVQAEDPATGELRTFLFHAPQVADVRKTIQVDVARTVTAPEPVVYQPPPVTTTRQVVYTSPQPVYCPTPTYRRPSYRRPRTWTRSSTFVHPPTTTVRSGHRDQVQRAKVHTRNTLIGLTAASQVFTSNRRDRKRYRNVGLGLTLLNEIMR
jgi:hypothetical protein